MKFKVGDEVIVKGLYKHNVYGVIKSVDTTGERHINWGEYGVQIKDGALWWLYEDNLELCKTNN